MQSPAWRHVKRLLCLMGRRPDLLCGAIALTCALLVALRFTCSRAKDVTMPAKLPMRFFTRESPVVDLFLGQIDYADILRQDSEITLFFLYAPWCAQSNAAREQVEHVANKLADQVLFVAVNCWWHHGKCRKQRSFFYFPVINLYHRSFGPIEYKGPLTAGYIEKFIRRVMSPVLYIPSMEKLRDFLSSLEPGVLGFFEFNASPQPPGYLTFFRSALHSLQKDYIDTIRFAVITCQALAKEISLSSPGSVYLHRNINSSLVYPNHEMNFTAANICKWALDNRETLLHWIRPHGGKSLLLNNELKKGPALFMFIPFNPLAEEQPLLVEIMELALKYNSCTRSPYTNQQEQEDLDPASYKASKAFPCCNTVVLPQWHLLSRVQNVCVLCVNQSRRVLLHTVTAPRCNFVDLTAALQSFYLKEQFFLNFMSTVRACSNFLSSYSPYFFYSACCQKVSKGLTAFTTSQDNASFALSSQGKVPNGKLSHKVPHIEEKGQVTSSYHINNDSITGLRCRTNKTLNMYLLDSNLSWLYAERLGASGRERKFAAIIDLKEELHYIVDQSQPLIGPTLEVFIQNFSKVYSPLRRHLAGDPAQSTLRPQLITEVTTTTFRHVVLDSGKDVLLLFYTSWCGFCATLNHIFIRVTQLLSTDSLIVTRINIAQNDLPWEFMVDRVPTIMLFPQNRKDRSIKYPEDEPVTVPNLLRFILKYATLPSTAVDPPASCPMHYLPYKAGHISYLEREIQRLRAEIEVLHAAQDQLAERISEARKDAQDLKVQKLKLEQHNKALEGHKEQMQALYEQKAREVGTMADKIRELVSASESLLAENAMLKFLMVSLEAKNKAKPETENPDNLEDGTRPTPGGTEALEEPSDGSTTDGPVTLEYNKENRTD
ncbi:thioredoxin domain-containing protein 11 isoform X2 [Bufo gargarizans]|uniref:thioredoxin domain-containing protein 11 isoform X2 n=1 Tax=Bufo gargarizans TaxID=30331 RepID=UPI001CF309C8|nr:thioredoxin domain-containing protein 11 isoform X2 [Bufo gargarizans]